MRLIKLAEVMKQTALDRSSVYKYMKEDFTTKLLMQIGKYVAWVRKLSAIMDFRKDWSV